MPSGLCALRTTGCSTKPEERYIRSGLSCSSARTDLDVIAWELPYPEKWAERLSEIASNACSGRYFENHTAKYPSSSTSWSTSRQIAPGPDTMICGSSSWPRCKGSVGKGVTVGYSRDGTLSSTKDLIYYQGDSAIGVNGLQALRFALSAPGVPFRANLFGLHVPGNPKKGDSGGNFPGGEADLEMPPFFCRGY